jgi:hypothetical protein
MYTKKWTIRPGASLHRALALCLGFALIASLLAACGDDGELREHYSRGRALDVYATEPQMPDRMVIRTGRLCEDSARHRVLEHTNPNRTYAAVQVRVVNLTSGVVPLFVNSESAQLGDPRSDEVFALDPCAAGEEYELLDGEEATHTPLIWGNVELKKGFQVQGWMFFDVPKALTLDVFRWQDPETQTIVYSRNIVVE